MITQRNSEIRYRHLDCRLRLELSVRLNSSYEMPGGRFAERSEAERLFSFVSGIRLLFSSAWLRGFESGMVYGASRGVGRSLLGAKSSLPECLRGQDGGRSCPAECAGEHGSELPAAPETESVRVAASLQRHGTAYAQSTPAPVRARRSPDNPPKRRRHQNGGDRLLVASRRRCRNPVAGRVSRP
jgi:hypothetical protein